MKWANQRGAPIVPVHTKEEVYEFARSYLEPQNEWLLEVGVQARRHKGRIVWHVCTNVPKIGAHTELTIDDETLTVARHIRFAY